ncbi:MAG TPA: hypothetical protein VFC63_12440 [Blastocatellia bacterium]|nr:hypothetical protein [Blastocatellia bacterium]
MRINLFSLLGIVLVALTLPLGFGGHNSKPNQATVAAAPMQGLASGNDLYCAGYISADPVVSKLQIIASDEKSLTMYSEGNKMLYLSQGEKDDVKKGNVYEIVRPEGKFKNEYSKKKLGYMNREVGVIRVVAAQYSTATAEVLFACEDIKNGDLLKPIERRPSPQIRSYQPLDRYNDNTLKNSLLGEIVATRYNVGAAAERSVVHLDLGADDGVKVGDYFTVFSRADGMTEEKFAATRSSGIVKGLTGEDHLGKQVKETRSLPAHVAGEIAVIHVEGKSAVAIVTRQTGEIMVGDFAERQDQ